MAAISTVGWHWLAVVLAVALGALGLGRGWPRETLSLVTLLAARGIASAAPGPVGQFLDAAGWHATGTAGWLFPPLGPAVPVAVTGAGGAGSTPEAALALLTVMAWVVALPLGRVVFPRRPGGPVVLLGALFGACNGGVLALALAPLLPDDGLAALPERWLLTAAGPWFEQVAPPLFVGATLIVVVAALLSGAAPARKGGR